MELKLKAKDYIEKALGIPTDRERKFASPERLADIMALIQVLALDKHPKRTEKGLLFELQDPPRSSKQWLDVAHEHPEFFRVSEHPSVSLIARYVSLDNAAADDPDAVEKADTRLDAEFTSGLLQTAIDMHDRQVRRADRWTYLIPIWVAVIGGVGAVFVALIKSIAGT